MEVSNTTEDNWQSQLADYAFGVMDGGAALEFERKLVECREHVELAEQYREIAGWLAMAVPPAEPPAGHKSRLMARVTATPQSLQQGSALPSLPLRSQEDLGEYAVASKPSTHVEPELVGTVLAEATAPQPVDMAQYRERRKAVPALALLATAAAALIVAVGVWGWVAQRSNAGVINIPEGVVGFPVESQGDQLGASAVVLFNPNTNEASLLFNGLQPLPADKVYELWLLPKAGAGEAKPVPAGVFTPGKEGKAQPSVRAPSQMRDYGGVAVTIETGPSGANAPTQDPIMVGAYAIP